MKQKKGLYERYIKRLVDVVCCIVALLMFWWLFVVLAILVHIKLGSPVLFKQPRPGKDEKIFYLYKFRTMTDERDENGKLLSDEFRLTKFGKMLRSTSLDELPELFNIIKGDMSLIGPRPLLVEYLPYYTEREKHRHNVKPGLTGLAQVNGRNFLGWDERFELDVQYVENITMYEDLKIIFKTIKKILTRSDVAPETHSIEGNMAEMRRMKMDEDI